MLSEAQAPRSTGLPVLTVTEKKQLPHPPWVNATATGPDGRSGPGTWGKLHIAL